MPAINSSKFLVTAGMDDVPHLDELTKREMIENTLPHMRDARSKGIPSLGSGAIYPIEQSEITCAPFAIPKHFKKGYGMDVGWNRTAAIFGAWDVDSDTVYLYSEHYRGQAEPSLHADAIKARGEWLLGECDPAGSDQSSGERLLAIYQNLGLHLNKADKAVEAGILAVWQRLASGRMKVFSSCTNWLAEHRLYRRDEHGKIVKAHDHLMDSTRYLTMNLVRCCQTEPVKRPAHDQFRIADAEGGY